MEAFFLDHGRYEEWATLLHSDITYRCPGDLFAAEEAGAPPRAHEVCENGYDFLIGYARRLRQMTTAASKLRRCITNVIVATGPGHREFTVCSYSLLTGAAGMTTQDTSLTVERHDVIRRCQRSYRILKREVSFDIAGAHIARLARLL